MCCCQTVGLTQLRNASTQFPPAPFTGLTGAEPSRMCHYPLQLQTPLTEVTAMAPLPVDWTHPSRCASDWLLLCPTWPLGGVTRPWLALSLSVGGARPCLTAGSTLGLSARSVAALRCQPEGLSRPQQANRWHDVVGTYYMEALWGGYASEEMLAKPCPF